MGQSNCSSAHLQGHGCLQRLWQDHCWRRAQPVVFDGEPSGCNESIQCVLELQGCREGLSMIVVVSTMRRAVQTLQLRTFRTCGPGLANLGVWLQVCTWSTRRAFSLCIVCAVYSSGRSGRIVQNLQRVHCNTY